jgi:Bacterial sugar transferase
VKLDLWYINNWSLGFDINILMRTCFEVLRDRAYWWPGSGSLETAKFGLRNTLVDWPFPRRAGAPALAQRCPAGFSSEAEPGSPRLRGLLRRGKRKGFSLREDRLETLLVHVHTGGQAIVGSVSQSREGRDNDENRGQPHAPENAGAITFAPGTTLPSADAAREAMPVASGRR